MDLIPSELVEVIVNYLNIKDVISLYTVSKSFKNMMIKHMSQMKQLYLFAPGFNPDRCPIRLLNGDRCGSLGVCNAHGFDKDRCINHHEVDKVTRDALFRFERPFLMSNIDMMIEIGLINPPTDKVVVFCHELVDRFTHRCYNCGYKGKSGYYLEYHSCSRFTFNLKGKPNKGERYCKSHKPNVNRYNDPTYCQHVFGNTIHPFDPMIKNHVTGRKCGRYMCSIHSR